MHNVMMCPHLPLPFQTLMNVMTALTTVPISAIIPMAPTPAVVNLDTHSMLMATPVMVSPGPYIEGGVRDIHDTVHGIYNRHIIHLSLHC